MKIKISIILCSIVCVLLVVSQWSPSEKMSQSRQSPSGKSNTIEEARIMAALPPKPLASLQPAQETQEQPPKQSSLKDTIKQGYGDGAVKAKDAMETFLKTWNPIGRSAQELKATFGNPSEEKADSITYMFDTGAFGWVFEFVLQNGKVVELKRPPSE